MNHSKTGQRLTMSGFQIPTVYTLELTVFQRKVRTLGIQLPDMSRNLMVQLCPLPASSYRPTIQLPAIQLTD